MAKFQGVGWRSKTLWIRQFFVNNANIQVEQIVEAELDIYLYLTLNTLSNLPLQI